MSELSPDLQAIIAEEEAILSRISDAIQARRRQRTEQQQTFKERFDEIRSELEDAQESDLAHLSHQITTLRAVAARSGSGALPDAGTPYFAHLVIEVLEEEKVGGGSGKGVVRAVNAVRHLLLGYTSFIDSSLGYPIIDWRHAPLAKIFFTYREGDEFEEEVPGRIITGKVVSRRVINIRSGRLAEISGRFGFLRRDGEGPWESVAAGATLRGGESSAVRGSNLTFERRSQEVPGGAISALLDSTQYEVLTTDPKTPILISGNAGSGKTTVAIHRLAYLMHENPRVYNRKSMMVAIPTQGLSGLYRNLMKGLNVADFRVNLYETWVEGIARRVVQGIPKRIDQDPPPYVTEFKRSHQALSLIDGYLGQQLRLFLGELQAKTRDFRPDMAAGWPWGLAWGLAAERLVSELEAIRPIASSDQVLDGGDPRPPAANQASDAILDGDTKGLELFDGSEVAGGSEDMLEDADEVEAPSGVDLEPGDAPDDDDLGELPVEKLDQVRAASVAGGVSLQGRKQSGQISAARQILNRFLDKLGEPFSCFVEMMTDSALIAATADGDLGRAEKLAVYLGSIYLPPRTDVEVDDDFKTAEGESVADYLSEQEGEAVHPEDFSLSLVLWQRIFGSAHRGWQHAPSYEHIFIDEVQEFAPVELSVLRLMGKAGGGYTVSGDFFQKISNAGLEGGWNDVVRILELGRHQAAFLNTNYRSPRQIAEAAWDIAQVPADRRPRSTKEGGPVLYSAFQNFSAAMIALIDRLSLLMDEEPHASIAVLVQKKEMAIQVYQALQVVPDVRDATAGDFTFRPGIDVTVVAEAKGLEFDYVVIPDVDAQNYPDTRNSRYGLHMAMTRAMHQLWIFHVGSPSPILPESIRRQNGGARKG